MPGCEVLFAIARRYRVKLTKLDHGKYRIAGDHGRTILMVVDEHGEVWYGTYGVAPFPHAVTRKLIPVTCYARQQYGKKAENLDEPFAAVAYQEFTRDGNHNIGVQHTRKITKDIRYREQGGRCFYCAKAVNYDQGTLDHMTPKALGGADAPYNMCFACISCNERKGQATAEQFMALLEMADEPENA